MCHSLSRDEEPGIVLVLPTVLRPRLFLAEATGRIISNDGAIECGKYYKCVSNDDEGFSCLSRTKMRLHPSLERTGAGGSRLQVGRVSGCVGACLRACFNRCGSVVLGRRRVPELCVVHVLWPLGTTLTAADEG